MISIQVVNEYAHVASSRLKQPWPHVFGLLARIRRLCAGRSATCNPFAA